MISVYSFPYYCSSARIKEGPWQGLRLKKLSMTMITELWALNIQFGVVYCEHQWFHPQRHVRVMQDSRFQFRILTFSAAHSAMLNHIWFISYPNPNPIPNSEHLNLNVIYNQVLKRMILDNQLLVAAPPKNRPPWKTIHSKICCHHVTKTDKNIKEKKAWIPAPPDDHWKIQKLVYEQMPFSTSVIIYTVMFDCPILYLFTSHCRF